MNKHILYQDDKFFCINLPGTDIYYDGYRPHDNGLYKTLNLYFEALDDPDELDFFTVDVNNPERLKLLLPLALMINEEYDE